MVRLKVAVPLITSAVILVPFEQLPGSHQVKNAERIAELNAAEVVKDSRMVQQPGILIEEVKKMVRSPKLRQKMAAELHKTYKPKAAKDLADILIDLANDTGGEDEKR